jgi:hypothetical protein
MTTQQAKGIRRRVYARLGLYAARPLRFRRKYAAMFVAFLLLCQSTALPTFALQSEKPRVRGVSVQKITLSESDPSQASVVLEISGENFGKPPKPAAVKLINQETGLPVSTNIISRSDSKIVASAQVPVGTKASKYVVQLSIDNVDVITPDRLSDYTLEIKKDAKAPAQAAPLEITFETFKSEQYPNLYSLLITNKNQNNSPGFSPNPALMKVDIVPPGATNVTVQPGSSPHQMVVTFLGPDKFDVKGVVVTVFDPNSTLGNSEPIAFSTPFEKKAPKADPNQHTISNVEILSLQRRTGIGRLLIQGSGFGDYERPPVTGDKEMLCCIERPMNGGERNSERSKEAGPGSEACTLIDGQKCQAMRDWRRSIEERVNVALIPRNPDLRVERTQIVYIDDKVIDVYFEFTHFPGYSEPFRLASVAVTINKGGVKTAQTHDAGATITASVAGPQTYDATHDIGVARDKNLEYRYTILDQKDASLLFGSGVADKFYVIELAMLNKAENKVTIPLSAIQAEIEWAYGEDPDRPDDIYYEEGPATIPPLALADVSAYFDSYQKTKGRRARVFNLLSGMATLGAALVPVFGHNIERPTAILTGGFTPALKTVFGDLSSEQLQNLTSRTWENVEEIPAKSGKTKFIFIQRGDQLFAGSVRPAVKKQIKNIRGLEVIGYEITQSQEKLATQQQ